MRGRIYENRGRGARWRVRFYVDGKETTRRFNDYGEAERFLTGLRFQFDTGEFDARDWKRENPLGFTSQAEKYLEYKKGHVRNFRNIRASLTKAIHFFGQKNVRAILYAELEDFAQSLPGTLSSKSRANIIADLHAFWVWLGKREGIPVPEFPKVRYTLGWRTTVDKDTQTAIIDEIRRLTWDLNPRIWLGVKWLATYYEIRPIELIHIREKDVNYQTGTMDVWYSKTDLPKVIYLREEDLELIRSMGPSFPDLYIFRHTKGNGNAKPGTRFGKDYLWKWWSRACKNLDIECDLYGGCRHSTVRHLMGQFTPEQIKHGGWQTNKAFNRYLGPVQAEQKRSIYEASGGRYVDGKNGQKKKGKVLKFEGKDGAEGRI